MDAGYLTVSLTRLLRAVAVIEHATWQDALVALLPCLSAICLSPNHMTRSLCVRGDRFRVKIRSISLRCTVAVTAHRWHHHSSSSPCCRPASVPVMANNSELANIHVLYSVSVILIMLSSADSIHILCSPFNTVDYAKRFFYRTANGVISK